MTIVADLVKAGEAMKAAFFTGNDNEEAIACMEWDATVETANDRDAASRAGNIPADVLDALERCEHFLSVPAGLGEHILRYEAWTAVYAVMNRIRAAAREAAK